MKDILYYLVAHHKEYKNSLRVYRSNGLLRITYCRPTVRIGLRHTDAAGRAAAGNVMYR
jgi:hypothetical protein